ncbi:hypothetical protein ABV409_05230 [Flagellimonas sp. DF-77]|uniref:hypothetical protein n=1 Tax=Flagellimonas algarum TaxID=3230298 RepID=UPI0033924EDE
MKLRILGLCLALFFMSCDDDDPCGGVIADVLTQTLYVSFENANGDNLIADGTISTSAIFTEFNGFRSPGLIFDDSLENVPESLRHQLQIPVVGEEDTDNTWAIELSATETDTLILRLRVESEGCSGRFYEILGVTYNGQPSTVIDLGDNNYQIRVVK